MTLALTQLSTTLGSNTRVRSVAVCQYKYDVYDNLVTFPRLFSLKNWNEFTVLIYVWISFQLHLKFLITPSKPKSSRVRVDDDVPRWPFGGLKALEGTR